MQRNVQFETRECKHKRADKGLLFSPALKHLPHFQAKNKLVKAHDEYKAYNERYGQVRDTFETKMYKACGLFQEHDTAFLNQYKTFLSTFARSLDDSQSAVSQVTGDYRQSLERIDVQAIMVKFIEERGTGMERPRKFTQILH